MTQDARQLVDAAIRVTERCRTLAEGRNDWTHMGFVGSALLTAGGNVRTGINVELLCGIGFCAEHSAVAEMLKHGESRIRMIAAATAAGEILPPCGRCRELLYQVDPANVSTLVVLPELHLLPLRELLPHNWQQYTRAVASPTAEH